MDEFPRVSVVIVNLNGKTHLNECLKSLMRLDYPKDRLEVIIVDNGSQDGSVEYIEAKFGWVKLIKNPKNEGFAKPSNDGARAASGDYVAFLNNDMKVRKDWLRELILSLKRSNAQCAGSVLLNWDGELLDFAGGSASFYGMGFQYDFHKNIKELESSLVKDKELFFACGGAMIVDRRVFLEIGGFDEDYFAYFEDLDLGWRLNIFGYKVVLSVKSRVFHKHHITGNRFANDRMLVLYNRNSLYTIYKNYGEEMLNKVFWPTILMDNALIFEDSKIDRDEFDLQKTREPLDDKGRNITNTSIAQLCAIRDLAVNIGKMSQKRAYIQANRKLSDQEIMRFFTDPFVLLGKNDDAFYEYRYDFIKSFGIDKFFGQPLKRKVLLISSDNIGKKMAGPGIRYWEMAKALVDTGKFDIELACPGGCELSYPGISTISYRLDSYADLLDAVKHANIIMLQGFALDNMVKLRSAVKKKYVIVDIYDPFMIENIEVFKEKDPSFRNARHKEALDCLEYQLKIGDFFVCANEKQKDYWIGMLSAFNRVTPKVYDIDKSGDRLVEIVPFGISDQQPEHNKKVLKGVWPGINENDKVLIWGGGVWNWFDPVTLVKAVAQISKTRSDVKLFFMGVKHPNPDIPEMKMLNQAVELAKNLGVYDKFVFFNYDWVDYHDRQNYLLEADIGVSCHFQTLETRFSFRTRILDYLWTGLPIICTKGDYFAELIEKEQLGKTVDFMDSDGLADAIVSLLDDREYFDTCKRNVVVAAEAFKWSRIVKPLESFCDHPIYLGNRSVDKDDVVPEQDKAKNVMFKRRKAARGSIPAMIGEIQDHQEKLEQDIIETNKKNDIIYDILIELQSWSYMMNDRFNKVKGALNPVRAIRKLFRRK